MAHSRYLELQIVPLASNTLPSYLGERANFCSIGWKLTSYTIGIIPELHSPHSEEYYLMCYIGLRWHLHIGFVIISPTSQFAQKLSWFAHTHKSVRPNCEKLVRPQVLFFNVEIWNKNFIVT